MIDKFSEELDALVARYRDKVSIEELVNVLEAAVIDLQDEDDSA